MIVAGIGFNSMATELSLGNALARACQSAGITAVDALASVATKTDLPLLQDFAARQNLPLITVTVAGVSTPSQSARVQGIFGTGSLAEAAALQGAAQSPQLLCTRVQSDCGHATAAIAQSQEKS